LLNSGITSGWASKRSLWWYLEQLYTGRSGCRWYMSVRSV